MAALLEIRHLDQRDLAEGIRVSEGNVSRALRRSKGFDRHWPAIARFFGVSLDWLLTPAPSLDTERNPERPRVEAVASPASGAASDADQTPASQE